MKLSAEEYQVIGDPSQLGVQEALFAVLHETEEDTATTDPVAAKLMGWDDLTEVAARSKVIEAVATGEVGIDLSEDDVPGLWLDPVTEARIVRRYNYWNLHRKGGEVFHAHVENEEAYARQAVRQFIYDNDGDLPTWDDVVDSICDLLGSECYQSGGNHIALNALDAGAIYMTSHPTRSQALHFDLAEEGNHDGLES